MAKHRFVPDHYHSTLAAHAPVMHLRDGDTVTTRTLDAHGYDHENVLRGPDTNPMTGPFFIDGAEPGDTLAVDIHHIRMTRVMGWTRQGLAWHIVDPSTVRDMPAREKIFWRIDNNAGVIRLEKPAAALSEWSLPIAPMIGCFGVAPDDGEAISTATSGRYGGNMDYRRFGEGATAYFPVSVPGALFCLGDAHGAQGDGEIAGTGIETSAEVEFTVRLIKGKRIGWPRGENATSIFTVGNARPLEQALQHATTEMLAWLAQDFGLDAISASHILGMHVRYDVANVFNPAFSVSCRLEKSALAAFPRKA
ncbi:MAG: acetamidase/formamidase family protein [Proteobacteria bacterium]|nr:acetamidase/formamidase family protein [Pseudomonadota bacterium]